MEGEKGTKIVFPEIDGVEWEYAQYKMKDDRLLFEAAKDFYDLNEAEAMTLERFFGQILSGSDGSMENFRIKVHSMKSSAALIGAMNVSALAKVLESAAAEENISLLKSITPFFLKEWRKLKMRMKEMFMEDVGAKRAPDYFMLFEYLKLLKAAIWDMDIDTSDEIIHQMKSFRYSEVEREKMEELALAVTEIDPKRTVLLAEELEELFMRGL